jgi:signal transduction histidine kinase/ABC-type uncharacterized transport system substrate-binding protein
VYQISVGRWVALVAVALCLLVPGAPPASGQPALPAGAPPSPGHPAPEGKPTPTRRVLLLYTEPRLTPAIVTVDGAIRSTLLARSPVPVAFYTEYLDLNMFDGAGPLPELRGLLRQKYKTRPLDLILAGGSRSLRVAVQISADLFGNPPIVFTAVDPPAIADLGLGSDVTGTWLHQGWAETLELARRLQPETHRVVVVNGSSPVDRAWLAEGRRQLAAAGKSIEVAYLTDMSLEQVLTEVKALRKGTVVLFGVYLRDPTGRDWTTPDAVARVSAAAGVPVYALTEVSVGSGAVGGHVVRFAAHGTMAAELALRVLAGERPPPTDAGSNAPVFDARQLARWGLDERRLPAGSLVLFQEPSPWVRYRWYIVGAGAVVLVQSGLIAGLLVHRAQRRRAQRILAERLRFETLVSNLSSRFAASSAFDAEQSIQGGLQLVGEGLGVDWVTVRMLDVDGEARLAQAWTRAGVAPRPSVIREDQTPWILARVRQGHVVRVARPDGLPAEAEIDRRHLQALDLRSTAVLPLIAGSAVLGLFSVGMVRQERRWPDDLISRLQLLAEVFANTLERRRAALAARDSELQIRDLAGRVLTAQEEERSRIARDLHDDVNQELAAVSIALSSLGGRLPPGTTSDVGDELAELDTRIATLSESIRHLSHELHPGMLQHVGLVAALRGYCRRFAREQGLAVTFHADGDLGSAPPDVGLCFYRVVQEGLGNVAKHAGAREARVTLEARGRDISLSIVDDGSGFDPGEARSGRGLGLLSLDERVRLVGGRLTVDTQPLRGTELRIVVPLERGQHAARDRSAG